MRIVVAGGTGFIGLVLCQRLAELGHTVTVLTRDPVKARTALDPCITVAEWLTGDAPGQRITTTPKQLAAVLEGSDVLINLAGEPITMRRWTEAVRRRLYESRIGTTSLLVSAVTAVQTRPRLLINASAVGYYGAAGDEPLTEASPSGGGFLAALCRDWEAAARTAEAAGVRVVLLRIGMVLEKDGGALARMLPAFRLGLGGPLGRGTQWVSWVHRDDVIGLIALLLSNADKATGPVNATAPHPVMNREFARCLGRALGKPAWARVPASVLRVLLGQMAEELLLTGQRVLPSRAERMGYVFRYPHLPEALHAILH